jgi:diguanylate cyclase (GGDEF)-like protein/PAS domain S-box-containing protein
LHGENELMFGEQRILQSVIDSLTARIAIIDNNGKILLVNKEWSRFARANGLRLENGGLGSNYLTVCDAAVGDGEDEAREAAMGIRQVIAGKLEDFYLEYTCHARNVKCRFGLHATRLNGEKDAGIIIVHEDNPMRKLAVEQGLLGETQYWKIFDVAGDAIFLMEGDRFIDCNASTLEIFACTRKQILNSSPYQFSPLIQPDGRDSKEKALEYIQAALNGKSQLFEWTHIKADGTPFPAEVRLNRVDFYGRPHILASVRDISRRRQADAERAMNESRLNSLLELSQRAHTLSEKEVVRWAIEAAVNLTGSEIGYLHFVNPDEQTIELVTWSEKTLEQCSMVYDSHYPIDQAGVWADCVRSGEPVIHNDYQGLPDKKGYPKGHIHLIRHVSVLIYRDEQMRMILGVGNKNEDYNSGDVLQINLIGDQLQRILQRKQAESELKAANEQLQTRLLEIESLQVQLRQQAIRDYLTGLFNRRYMEETLKREIARAGREATQLSLMILDGDNFKAINDTFGHQAGDVVLKELADFLLEKYRAGDVICRYGGDEFVVVMPNASVEHARVRAEEWQRSFGSKKIKYQNEEIAVSFSIGIATYPVHANSSVELLQSADQALYFSKDHKTKVAVFDDKLD